MTRIATIILSVSLILNSGMFNCQPQNINNINEQLFDLLTESLITCDEVKKKSIKEQMLKLKEELKCSAFETEYNNKANNDFRDDRSSGAIYWALDYLKGNDLANEIVNNLKNNQIKDLSPIGIDNLFGLDIGFKKDSGDLYIGTFKLNGSTPKYSQNIYQDQRAKSIKDGVYFSNGKEFGKAHEISGSISKIVVVKKGRTFEVPVKDFKSASMSKRFVLKNDKAFEVPVKDFDLGKEEALIFGNEIALALDLDGENKKPAKYKEYLSSKTFKSKQEEYQAELEAKAEAKRKQIDEYKKKQAEIRQKLNKINDEKEILENSDAYATEAIKMLEEQTNFNK